MSSIAERTAVTASSSHESKPPQADKASRRPPTPTKRTKTLNRPAPKAALSPVLIVAMILLVVLFASGFILYPVAHDRYVAHREKMRVDAEYRAVYERNLTIEARLTNAQTPEGIEDRAREQFGWVREGEQAVNITGLQSSSPTVLPEAVAPGSIMPYSEWWTQTLDSLFGYEYSPPASLPIEAEPIPGL